MNKTKMQEVLDAIKADPESHDQMDFRCGTTMCFGGWACELNGWRFGEDRQKHIIVSHNGKPLEAWVTPDMVAQEELGLSLEQANALFFDLQAPTHIVIWFIEQVIAGKLELNFDNATDAEDLYHEIPPGSNLGVFRFSDESVSHDLSAL